MQSRPMDWTEMPYFLAVARHGSLRLAAESMGVSHGTVDRHINALEVACDTRLFQRTSSGMILTTCGEALRPAAEEAEALILGARQSLPSMQDALSGRVRFAMPSWIAYPIIAPRIHAFRELYPGIDLEIMVSNRFQSIARAEADVSLRVAFEVDEDVVGKRLFVWHDAVISSEAYLRAHWDNRGNHGEGLHWLGWGGPDPDAAWQNQHVFPKAKTVHKVADEIMFTTMLRQGHGMAIYPVVLTSLYAELVRVPDTPVLPDRSLWMLLHRDLQKTARVRAVVDFFGDALMALKGAFQGNGSPVFKG